ncbi:MAG: DUF512 domain-containing protein [bacterium]
MQALQIKSIDPASNGQSKGLKAGDKIAAVNDHPITDIIDYYFYSSDTPLKIKILKPDNNIVQLKVKDPADLGLSFNPIQFRKCGNNCIFCFIDQNPAGMRKSLYEKDEDYRLSFLYGNYVTLTNVSREDLNRIVEQKLSPLYVSIHAVQPPVRKKLLGVKKDDHLLDKISFLTNHDIELHAQIVLCPGINDGKILQQTIEKLSQYYPALKTLAVVPVGLTRYRKNLPFIQPVTQAVARQVLSQVHKLQENFENTIGTPFVFLADEFYLLSGSSLPPEEHYGEFYQVDNGVGLTRHFIHEFTLAAEQFPELCTTQRRLIFITGEMACPVIEKHILPVLNQINGLYAEAYAVENKFYGSSVTVSGLLTGKDIIDTCTRFEQRGEILLPDNCINSQGFFLDDLTIEDMKRKLQQEVRVITNVEDII